MTRNPPVVHKSLPLDSRLNLPQHFCDRVAWLNNEKKEIDAWLFFVEPGRYRLLCDEDVQNDPQLEPIRAARELHAPPPASSAKPMRAAATVAKLIPVTIDFHKGWRIPIGDELAALAPPNTNTTLFSILMPEGYLEIWYSDELRRALHPWAKEG